MTELIVIACQWI